jgi:hypothetical protein
MKLAKNVKFTEEIDREFTALWNITLRSLTDVYRYFGGTYCFDLHGT